MKPSVDIKNNLLGARGIHQPKKANIEDEFTAKTAFHIQKLREDLDTRDAFGRSDVREMAERGIKEPVSGHEKGKYRFRHQKG